MMKMYTLWQHIVQWPHTVWGILSSLFFSLFSILSTISILLPPADASCCDYELIELNVCVCDWWSEWSNYPPVEAWINYMRMRVNIFNFFLNFRFHVDQGGLNILNRLDESIFFFIFCFANFFLFFWRKKRVLDQFVRFLGEAMLMMESAGYKLKRRLIDKKKKKSLTGKTHHSSSSLQDMGSICIQFT